MPSELSVELFGRSLAQATGNRQVQRTLDHVDRLVDSGVLGEYTVTVWGAEIFPAGPATRTEAGRHILDSIQTIEEWAADNGVRVDRFYETRTIERDLTGQTDTITSLPTVAMVEYTGGEVQYVTLHESGETVETVENRLETLAERGVESPDEPRVSPVA